MFIFIIKFVVVEYRGATNRYSEIGKQTGVEGDSKSSREIKRRVDALKNEGTTKIEPA